MWEIAAGMPASKARSRPLSAIMYESLARARTVAVPYRLGEVLIGDDPFNGRREGTVTVKKGTFVGLQTEGQIYFYDYRQLRRPD
jgi:hypothetical protein